MTQAQLLYWVCVGVPPTVRNYSRMNSIPHFTLIERFSFSFFFHYEFLYPENCSSMLKTSKSLRNILQCLEKSFSIYPIIISNDAWYYVPKIKCILALRHQIKTIRYRSYTSVFSTRMNILPKRNVLIIEGMI